LVRSQKHFINIVDFHTFCVVGSDLDSVEIRLCMEPLFFVTVQYKFKVWNSIGLVSTFEHTRLVLVLVFLIFFCLCLAVQVLGT